MVFKASLVMFAKGLSACVLSVGLLWQIADRIGPQTGEVAVYVSGFPSVVTIDGESCTALSWRDSPVVYELRGGWHDLQICRDDVVTHQQRFHVDVGANNTVSEPALPTPDATRPLP